MEKLESLWDHIHEKDLKLNDFNVPYSLKCRLCFGILKNAVFSSCGCRYCKCCIKDYLKDDKKECPGCKKDDISSIISFKEFIKFDPVATKEIMKIVLECPYENCNEKVEVRNLLNHLSNCNNRKVKCAYHDIGSICDDIKLNELDNHLTNNQMYHNQVLVDAVKRLQNELSMLKTENGELKIKIKNLENSFSSDNKPSIQQDSSVQSENNSEQKINRNSENISTGFNKSKPKINTNIVPIEKEKPKEVLLPPIQSPGDYYATEISKIFTNIRNSNITYLQPFSLLGYTFNLRVWFRSNTLYANIAFVDDSKLNELKWPIPYKINIGIMNANAGELLKSISIEKDKLNKPIFNKSKKSVIIESSYMSLPAITENLFSDSDCVTIKCFLSF